MAATAGASAGSVDSTASTAAGSASRSSSVRQWPIASGRSAGSSDPDGRRNLRGVVRGRQGQADGARSARQSQRPEVPPSVDVLDAGDQVGGQEAQHVVGGERPGDRKLERHCLGRHPVHSASPSTVDCGSGARAACHHAQMTSVRPAADPLGANRHR